MNTRPTGPWGLIMLNPVTPPYYLIIKHSENCALAEHILCDSPPSPLKMPPWNPLGSSDFLSTSCPRILVWCLKINAAISCTTSWCQRIGFTAWRRVGPQVWFGNSSKKIKKKKQKLFWWTWVRLQTMLSTSTYTAFFTWEATASLDKRRYVSEILSHFQICRWGLETSIDHSLQEQQATQTSLTMSSTTLTE